MTEEKFTELVNLYLDREISERGLVELKAELAANSERKAAFHKRCRLHQAMRLAMNPAASRQSSIRPAKRSSDLSRSNAARGRSTDSTRTRGSSRSGPRSRSRSSSRSTRSSRKSAEVSTRTEGELTQQAHFPRWIMGTGLAASFVLGFTLLTPVFRDTTHVDSQAALVGVEADELVEVDPLDTIGRSELRRFATTQAQRAGNQRASIAAQLRLMGLRPEYTPTEKQLRSVSLAAAQRPMPARNDAELLASVQQMSPMPVPQILRVESSQSDSTSRWPSGFHSSLASFK